MSNCLEGQAARDLAAAVEVYRVRWNDGQGCTGVFPEQFTSEAAANSFGEDWVVRQTNGIDEDLGPDFEGFSAETILEEEVSDEETRVKESLAAD
jgi:hypothetical protein